MYYRIWKSPKLIWKITNSIRIIIDPVNVSLEFETYLEKNKFCRTNYWPSKRICKIWNFPFWPHHLNYVENMKYSNMQILLVKFLVWLEIWEGLLSWTKKLGNIILSWSILICVFGIPMHRWNHLAALLSQKFENLFLFDYRTDLKDAWQIAIGVKRGVHNWIRFDNQPLEFLFLSCSKLILVINKLDIWWGENWAKWNWLKMLDRLQYVFRLNWLDKF